MNITYGHDQYPEVEVTSLDHWMASDPILPPANANLGDGRFQHEQALSFLTNSLLNSFLQQQRDQASTAYILRWNGSRRVPRGAVVGSRVIGRTQHGFVTDTDGNIVGDYTRIKDVVGPKLESVMLVFMQPEPVESDQADEPTPPTP